MKSRPIHGWLEPLLCDARRRLVSLLSSTFRDFSTGMALNLLSGTVDTKILTATDLIVFFTPYDLKRLDMYARNMVDYHLIADIIPAVSRLYFLGHLQILPSDSLGNCDGGTLSMSTVQKAILLAVGLQHRSMESVSVELNLPANQVLGLFNKAVRKLNAYLKELAERDAAFHFMSSVKTRVDMSRVTQSAIGMAAAASTLDDDLEDGARQALTELRATSAILADASGALVQNEDAVKTRVYGESCRSEKAPKRPRTGGVSGGGGWVKKNKKKNKKK